MSEYTNWTGTYAKITKDELIAKMRDAMARMAFSTARGIELPNETKEERTVKRIFEIEFPDDPAVLDITAHDLRTCMCNKIHISQSLQSGVTVTDITDEVTEVAHDSQVAVYPDSDAWEELHVLLDGVRGRADIHRAVEDWIYEYVFTDDTMPFGPPEQCYPTITYKGMEITYVPVLDCWPEHKLADGPFVWFLLNERAPSLFVDEVNIEDWAITYDPLRYWFEENYREVLSKWFPKRGSWATFGEDILGPECDAGIQFQIANEAIDEINRKRPPNPYDSQAEYVNVIMDYRAGFVTWIGV